jgi:hypothetical protein
MFIDLSDSCYEVMLIEIPGIMFRYQNRINDTEQSNNRTLNSRTKQIEQNGSRTGSSQTEMNEFELKQLAKCCMTTDKQQQINWGQIQLKTDALNINEH